MKQLHNMVAHGTPKEVLRGLSNHTLLENSALFRYIPRVTYFNSQDRVKSKSLSREADPSKARALVCDWDKRWDDDDDV